VCNWNAINLSFGDAAEQGVSYELLLAQGMVRKKKPPHQLANSEIVAGVSDSVDRMFVWGTATTILPEEALPCCPFLRSVERLVRLRDGQV